METSTVETMERTSEEEAEEEAAFEAAMNPDQEPEPAQEEPPKEEPKEETEPEEPVEKPLTIEDLKAMLEEQRQENARFRDKAFGKMGELQQRIEAARSTVSGISPKAKERLSADFPELAEMLFENSDEPAAPAPTYTPAPSVDVEDLVKRQVEPLKLALKHPDWEQAVGSQEFKEWKAKTLAPETAHELDNSWDSSFIAGKLTEFKTWREKQQSKKQHNKERLDAAITPKGIPRQGVGGGYSDDDEETAMLKAFNARS